jgi:hypothetical protein
MPNPDKARMTGRAGTPGRFAAYYKQSGAEPLWQGAMRGELYRVVHWVGIVALVVWTVYSAYSAISFS